jgi:hypothetical protein
MVALWRPLHEGRVVHLIKRITHTKVIQREYSKGLSSVNDFFLFTLRIEQHGSCLRGDRREQMDPHLCDNLQIYDL